MVDVKTFGAALSCAILLTGCGGGGGGEAGADASPPPPANAVPRFLAAASGVAEVAENTSDVVYLATATDADGDPLLFSMAGGPDASRLRVQGAGLVSFATPPDFETPSDADGNNVYVADISVSDGRATATHRVSITVRDLGATQVAPGVLFPDATPTAEKPVAALRYGQDRWLIRTLSVAGGSDMDFDEYILRNPSGYLGVANGWQLVGHRAMVAGVYRRWFESPEDIGLAPTQEFGWRLGRLSDPYVSGGEGPHYFGSGFGHGRMTYKSGGQVGGSSILLNSAAPDHAPTSGVGTALYGSSLDVLMNYNLHLHDGTAVADAAILHQFSVEGLQEYVRITITASGIGVNDSASMMYPLSGGDRIKPVGLPAVQRLMSGAQRRDWATASFNEIQFYDSRDPTVMATMVAAYGQPIRRPDHSLPAFALTDSTRFFVTDYADYMKFYGFAFSSEVDEPRTARAATGTYEAMNRIRTRIRPSGPL